MAPVPIEKRKPRERAIFGPHAVDAHYCPVKLLEAKRGGQIRHVRDGSLGPKVLGVLWPVLVQIVPAKSCEEKHQRFLRSTENLVDLGCDIACPI
jgi:hypothetical protein